MGSTGFLIRGSVFLLALYLAYNIRLHAVINYGRVIHEFDPWFNFRAAEYLVNNGWEKFSTWFDYESWYPIGRPVGTTIYPGLQVTAAFLYDLIHSKMGMTDITLNDVCVFMPAGFGCVTCTFVALLAYEATRNANVAAAAAFIMAIIPAHLMRSVAGGFDNESIAVAAMCSTFYFYARSLRDDNSWIIGVITGVSYIYMVGAWGGYVFVLNIIGLHAGLNALFNYSPRLLKAYGLFYIIGTWGAIQFPVVGLAPLKSLEQLGAAGALGVLVLREVAEIRFRSEPNLSPASKRNHIVKVFVTAGVGALVAMFVLLPEGYFGPLSARIRGLFVQHTRTGNPLVDSVAEHQATRPEMYLQYFQMACFIAPFGLIKLLFKPTYAKTFVILYSLVSMYFSSKMVRLVLLLSPGASILTGVAVASLFEWTVNELTSSSSTEQQEEKQEEQKSKKKNKKSKKKNESADDIETLSGFVGWWNKQQNIRRMVALVLSFIVALLLLRFYAHCNMMAVHLSNPSIMIKGRTRDGNEIMIDDFRESYWWLRDNTPKNSRVMAWWDYGYQINGIANRTTIADGNTWNHEHIALLGRTLVSNERDAHAIARHLADYVLVWSTRFGGMYGDDMAKSPHMARISGSVYSQIKPQEFYQDQQGNPSPMMRESLIYRLHGNRFVPGIKPLDLFEEVFTSKHNMVRIYKIKDVSEESRKYCDEHHAYPPALKKILAQKKDFEQLEDFNRKKKKSS